MTCAAVTKLLVVFLVAFILCLPEFFSSHRGLKVSFCCESFKPCADGSDGGCGGSEGMWVKGQPICNGEINSTEQNISSYWLLCETQTNLTNLFVNTSLIETHLEVSLSVRVDSPSAHNVTVHHQLENASSFIRSSEHLQGLFHCCVTPNNNTQNLLQNTTPPHPFSGVSHCFLHAQRNNQTASFYCPHQMEGNESKRVWFGLILIVISITVVTVVYQVLCKPKHLKRKVERLPDSAYQPRRLTIRRTTSFDGIPEQSLLPRYSTGDVFFEATSQKDEETLLQVYKNRIELSPIREVEKNEVTGEKQESGGSLLPTQDFTHCQWGPMSQLHHRGHPPTVSLMSVTTEDQN
ncbi:uncharacterized protein si:dkey-192k22.2 isoform X2 [Clupea harengus]|uniref:Uncharacterized protein si:dkey-192k22.2 isoform X2 n=1 Tax=Clupea harengus TaxID=7950 RepID=A0A6P8EGF6_CLUHA|nr:uncharacterized protein si:dkey-192k22.2 isoform X2 [Clupea harengus]